MFKRNIKLTTAVSLFALALITVAVPSFVAARDYGLNKTRNAADLPATVAGASSPDELVGVIVSAVLSLIGIVFFFIIFYSGFRWMTARGNSDVIDKSKDAILSATIGLVIVMAAYAITNFIFTELGSSSSSSGPDAACPGTCSITSNCSIGSGYHIDTTVTCTTAGEICCVPD